MVRRPGFFDVEEPLRELSAKGDDLKRITAQVDFAMFRGELEQAVPRADGAKGGRPACDHVLMFKILLPQAMHGLSDERCEYLIKGLPVVHALPRPGARRPGAGRQHDLGVPRGVDEVDGVDGPGCLASSGRIWLSLVTPGERSRSPWRSAPSASISESGAAPNSTGQAA